MKMLLYIIFGTLLFKMFFESNPIDIFELYLQSTFLYWTYYMIFLLSYLSLPSDRRHWISRRSAG